MEDMVGEDKFIAGYRDFSVRIPGPLLYQGFPADGALIAEFKLGVDVSSLAPYISAITPKAVYCETPDCIKFLLGDICCMICEDRGAAAAFTDRGQALDFMEHLLAFLNDIYRRRDSIEPNYRTYRPGPVLDIFRLLPRTNCGQCGFATCMAFAAALGRGKATPQLCPGFARPMVVNAVYPVLDRKGKLLSTVTLDLAHDATPPQPQMGHRGDNHPSKKPDGIGRMRSAHPSGGGYSPAMPLTKRELAVLRLLAAGATNTEISESLKISPHTVKSHVIHIFNKLGVDDRTQAAVWAVRQQLI